MLNKVRDYIREQDMAAPGDAVIVAHGGILVFLMNYLLRFHREPQEIIVANASLSVVS